MNVLTFLIPVALLLGAAGLVAFLWALRSGQYDDPEGAAERIFTPDPMEKDTPPR
ncbi:cbb3-type cytochrome oxidase assembly protein CcoS [Minwuia sp.]|uniref:cbb3-type cytochrome oxidase assembly protein CcoS n=1 Tax=Minwuia sp. TaxID=2493630 RepID=UPI003A8D39CA